MNILNKIKEVLKSYKFEALELKDGGKIKTDTDMLEVGSMVVLESAEGDVPAPAGEHTLMDGRTIVVDETGKVTEIKESSAPTAEEVAMEDDAAEAVGEVRQEIVDEAVKAIDAATPSDVTTEDAQAIAEEIVSIVEDKVAESTMEMKKQMEELKKMIMEMTKTQEKMGEEFSAFKGAPSGKSISQLAFGADGEVDVMSARIEAIKALRNQQ